MSIITPFQMVVVLHVCVNHSTAQERECSLYI
jgi:hypothetical protein